MSAMNWLVEAYRQIPRDALAPLGALIAALLASLITGSIAIVGVLASNRGAERRQRVELRAAEERARLERDQDLRKTIYLDALNDVGSSMTRSMLAWNMVSEFDPPLSEVSKSAGSGYRVCLVAGAKTVRALVEVGHAVNQSIFEAAPFRAQYTAIRRRLKQLESAKAQLQGERARLRDEVARSTPDAERLAAVELRQGEIDRIEATIVQHVTTANEQLARGGMDLLKRGAKSRSAIDSKAMALLVAFREELSLPALGEDTFKMLAESAAKEVAAADKFLDDTKALIPTSGKDSGASAEPSGPAKSE